MNTYKPIQIAIDTSTSGDNTLVAAEVGKHIVVIAYTLISRDTVDVRWKSGSNNKSGLLPLIPSVGASPAHNPNGVIRCNPSEALVLNLSSANYVGGHLTYEMHD